MLDAATIIKIAGTSLLVGICALTVWEVVDFLTGQTGRPHWWRQPACWLRGHDAGWPGDLGRNRCARCNCRMPGEER